MAIDPGTKRMGVALSDPLQMISSPYKVIHCKDSDRVLDEILDIVKEKQVVKVVIGLPIREDGEEGVTSPLSYRIKDFLDQKGVATELLDERYSSFIAQKRLQDQGIKFKKAKTKLDAYAATIILEDYLASLG